MRIISELTLEDEPLPVKGNLIVYRMCDDPGYLDEFLELKNSMGLADEDIDLYVPEDPEQALRSEPRFIADVGGSREEGYDVAVSPSRLQKSPLSLRKVLKHEFTHIKFGDCDRIDGLPWLIRKLYTYLIAEPRAYYRGMKDC